MAVAIVLFNSAGIDQKSLLSYLHFFLTRLPMLVIPLWLGIFASKKSSLLTRLEEFYAQKQTLAESYEGYKNRMNEIGEEASEELIELMKINLFSLGRDSKTVIDGAVDEKHGPMEQMMFWRDRRKSKLSNVPDEEVDG